ncbi:MAG: hypothetical protein IJR05_03920 [Acidaminococcaceae bacterium]|nr:hypothetical protein [Acidaminococcaceae bacterium]
MNKIYKVIWSKVRNCYVAVSEIAKRNGKSCTSVNCGAKANRGHTGVALAIALSLSMASGGVAWAAPKSITTDTTVSVDDYWSDYTLDKTGTGAAGSGVHFTVTGSNVRVSSITSQQSGNVISIENGGIVRGDIHGGINNNSVTVTGGTVGSESGAAHYLYGGFSDNSSITGNYVYINEGANFPYTDVVGGGCTYTSSTSTFNVTDNHVTMDGGTLSRNIYGGLSRAGNATGNYVTINNGIVKSGTITGGWASSGNATGNYVTINGGSITGSVRGGYSSSGSATGNTVTISGGTISNYVAGGESNNSSNVVATGNTVVLDGVTLSNTNIYGGCYKNNWGYISTDFTGDVVTGNKLILKKAGNSVGGVGNFERVEISNEVVWDPGKTVLTSSSFGNIPTLDISAVNSLKNAASKGTMTLIARGSSSSSYDISVKYDTNKTAALSSSNPWVAIKGNTSSTTRDSGGSGNKIHFDYYSNIQALSLENNKSDIVFSYAPKAVRSIVFDSGIPWETGGRSVTSTDFGFSGVNIDAAYLSFSFTDAQKAALKANGVMTLVSNAEGLTAGRSVSLNQAISYNIANVSSLEGTLRGSVATAAGAVNYKVSSMRLNSVNLASWNGVSSSAVPSGWTGWTKNTSGISVTTTGFTPPTDIAVGSSRDILTTSTSDYFKNATIGTGNEYKEHSFGIGSDNDDTENEVTFTGTQWKGVTTNDNNSSLIYEVDQKNVTAIAFGSDMTWGAGRTANSDYNFSGVSDNNIDASNLSFSFTDEAQKASLSSSSYMTLLSNATNLAADLAVKGASRTQAVDYNTTNGVILSGTLEGTVSTEAGAVKYAANSMSLDSVSLTGWDSTKEAVAVPNGIITGWTRTSGGVPVTTGNFTTSLLPGQSKEILTASVANFFGTISGDRVYSTETFTNNDGNTGVTLSGDHYKGVKVEDTGRTLKYYAETMDTAGIKLGTMTWGTTTGRTAGDLYIFNRVNSIDATDFSFSNPDAVSGSMYLLSNATGLAAGAVDISHTQADFTTNMGNGTAITATLTGTISSAEAGKVKYTATGTTISTIDLSGWDVSTSSAVPAGWTLKKNSSNEVDATVETANMNATMLSNLPYGSSVPILTATGTAYFDGIKINGANAWNGSGSIVDTDNSGVAIVGTTTGTGVKVDDANKNQIVYQKSKEDITKLTLGGITFAAGTTVRTFDNTYDLTAAPIVASDELFTDESQALMEADDTMTLVDATGAIKNASNETLAQFNGGSSKSYVVNFTDTIKSNSIIKSDSIKFTGTHTDTLSQEDDTATSTKKSLLKYEVGAKMVTKATLSGSIDWRDGGTYYTNGVDVNENGKDATYTFDGDTAVDIAGVQFSTTEDPIAGGKTKFMTLLEGVTGVVETNISGTPAFGVALTQNNTKLDAKATGSASVSGNDVIYSVNGVAIDKINVTSIAKAADTVPTGWTLAKDSSDNVIATVETDGLVVASPSGLESGETKVIIEAAAGSTAFFKDVSVNGSHAWKVDGSTITSDLDIGGVAITGTQTKGGVKVNEANTNQIIYEESKKKINTLTLGSVTFANDDGTAATVARTFDKTYDVSTATINADDLAFANSDIMEKGNSMRIVDASAAIPNAISNKKLPAFTEQTKKVAFTDTITGKNLTLKGAHTDTLSQDAAQTTLTYTVGDKVVSSATPAGDITWNDGGTYYANGSDVNQNGTKATYTFDGNSAVDISSVSFNAAADPLAGATKTMTLLKDVNGVASNKVSGTPAFVVTLDQTNTKLDAKATGSAGVSNSDVTYTVSGVAINKVNIKSVGSTADTVPANWTLAKDSSDKVIAKVETDNMTKPSNLSPGETKVIITATGTDYFSGVEVKGGYAWTSGGALTSDLEAGGVMVAGNQTKGGVKVNEANKNQLIYEETKKKLTSITLGEVTFAKDGTARAFDKTYDATSATINANNLKFAEASRAKMETGNTMTMVDATAALKNANDETLAQFNGGADKTYSIAFNDTVTGKNLTLAGTHTDTLSQADDTATSTKKSKLVYTVGDKLVSSATLTGDIAWNDGGTHYTNGSDANQNGTKATYKFDGNSAVDISGVAFSATSDPLAGTTKSMTLLKGVTGVVATKVSGTPSFAVTLDQTNTKLDASASGSAGVSGSDVTYTVSGVAINKVNIKSVGSTADTVPANWMLASGATVETDDLVVASPSGLEPGETKVLIKAADGATNYFNGVSVNGNYAWKVDNSTITSELDIGGVAITGTQTKGGVKVNEANTNQIIYEESKKKINTLTLGSVTFANDDGTAATVARTFDKTYDVSTATISADGLAFANSDTMETGNLMRIVDASAAIPNAISNNKLSAFAGQTYEVAFSDTITGKNLTLAGTHTDTLSQDAAQSTLTYTVGDKKVSSATLTGDIAWNDGGTHYTNGSDANQNGTKATYKFDGNSAVDISGVQFNATVDPLGKSMTLLKDVNGVVATKVSGTPSFTVALDQTNTKLDANATGDSGVSGNDVTFTVSGVTLDKITVKSANGTADKVPASWTMAAGATIETDSMNVPELAAGTHVDILQSDTDGFFANVPINGANAYGNTQETFTESDAAKSVSIAGTQDKGVTLNTEKKHLIYKAGTLDVASVTLGPAEWKKGATVFDRSGAGYNYADVAALGTDSFAVSYASPETIAAGDSMTLLQANATLKDMAERVKKTSYSYTPVTGVTVDANITGKLAISGGVVTFTAAENQAGKLTFGSVDWKDSSALMTRPKNITFSGADVDTAKINFTNITLLDANKQMTLVSDFGDKVGTITGTKYMVGTTSEGEGVASLSGSDLIFTTKTGAGGAAEQTHRTVMATEAGIAALAAGQEYVDSAVEGLGMLTNLSPDGTSTFAAMGGGASRYKTGSHVDTRTWNAVVAVGSKREHKKGTFEWGVFAEYGKGNYTLHSDDGGRGDGDTHYAGGGLLAKWTNKHKVYTEASVRMGRISDSASNMLRDGEGNQYGYNVHANYYGGHIGIGKLFEVKKNRELDVYGKFFYTRRNGVSFNAAGRYDLDAVNSSLLRVGARYGSTDKKWNWYGGLAYEYQFDGESGGMLNGNTPIRAASIKGGSVRGEIGLRMDATETNPWKVDFSIYGYGGKHRGIGGSVNVAYMF